MVGSIENRTNNMKHIVSFSGGIGSWAAAKRVVTQHGKRDVILLFADTLMEDEDLYRFMGEASDEIGVPITRIEYGMTPWQVFEKQRFIGNSKTDPCSKVLKRDLMDRWRKANCDPEATVNYVGIDWTESHRLHRLRKRAPKWKWEAPLCEPPYRLKSELLSELKACGIEPPRLYKLGFPHNNCGGFCCKAGHSAFRLLLRTMPERYAIHEAHEKRLREDCGINGTILADRKGGKKKQLTLEAFRLRCEAKPEMIFGDDLAAGCGCALD